MLAMTDAKLVFTLSESVETVLDALVINKSKCPVVAIRSDQRQSIPSGIIDFAQLMDPTGTIYIY